MLFKGVEVNESKNARKMAPILAFLNNHWSNLDSNNSDRSAGLLLVGLIWGGVCFSGVDMVGSSVKWQIFVIATVMKNAPTMGVSQRPMDESLFRQQQSIRRVLISRIEVWCFMFQWGLTW
jgi:hypothetical protein